MWQQVLQWITHNMEFLSTTKGVIVGGLPVIGALLFWWRNRQAFKNSQRLSEMTVESARVFRGERGGMRWVGANEQLGGVMLPAVFDNPFQLAYVYAAGKALKKAQSAGSPKQILTLKNLEQTKAMMIRTRNWLLGYLNIGVQALASGAKRPDTDVPTPASSETFYGFMRRDVWSDDRHQGFRLILVPAWQVQMAEADGTWLDSIHWDVSYQKDRVDHIRAIVEALQQVREKKVKDLLYLGVLTLQIPD